MTSKEFRAKELFLRNNFETAGKFGISLVKKQIIDLNDINLLSCSDAKSNDCETNRQRGIHFFVDDYRFQGIYDNPYKSLKKYSQYKFILTPDFSTYTEMPLCRQIESVARNRWCGAFWQSKGLTVIPTISWSTAQSFDFCFDGVEKNSIVAVGMIGCKRNKCGFLRGYNEMLKIIQPSAIICFGKPFAEMKGNIISVDYIASRKAVR